MAIACLAALIFLFTNYVLVPWLWSTKPFNLGMAVEFNNHATSAWVALHEGWFAEEGINLTCFESYVTGVELSAALARGDISAAYLCLAPALMSYARGVPIKIVAGSHLHGFAIVAKPEIESLSDLEGKTIGCTKEGTQSDLLLHAAIEKYNLADLDVRRMNPPMQVSALIAGKIDAICAPEFWCTLAASQGFRVIARSQDVWPDMQGSVLVVKEELIEEHPEVVRKLVKITNRGTEFIHDSPSEAAEILYGELTKADVKGLSADVLNVLGGEMNLVTPSLLEESMANLDYRTEINVASVQECINALYKLGYIDNAFNATDVLDLSFEG
ncbi:MAG: ABC transporter substrate-binding protein [Candidatus Brockarchaeota archaeon]|nr:ABC transporter substrate-binding protein [Candidatus Brockarchaeota archaeon]